MFVPNLNVHEWLGDELDLGSVDRNKHVEIIDQDGFVQLYVGVYDFRVEGPEGVIAAKPDLDVPVKVGYDVMFKLLDGKDVFIKFVHSLLTALILVRLFLIQKIAHNLFILFY